MINLLNLFTVAALAAPATRAGTGARTRREGESAKHAAATGSGGTVPEGTIKLNKLEPHTRAVVSDLRAPDGDLQRLMAMGVCKGRQVEMIQRGNPLILKVLGTRIGVSARLAKRILVEPCTDCHEAPRQT